MTESSELDDIRNTLTNVLKIIDVHAEGMQHMTRALIAFDSRVKELEKAHKTRRIIRLDGPLSNPD